MGSGISKTVFHASAPYKEIAHQEKRAHESSDTNFRVIMQRLDEESRERKILKEKLALYVRDFSEIDSSEGRRRSHHLHESQVDPPTTRCLLKNFKKRNVALGNICTNVTTPSQDSYNIRLDEVFDHTAELYVGEGTLSDASVGDIITWPKNFVGFV
ncbi:hypothetical protein AQUCO_10400009v1 [Aquilegia coerulea]|uniref:Uncharacterized protein n=1 Tax=Aquilegia coerulea TaxID=218851 RepID=A0A2G5C3M9_AQUCA|nr:hypothetical protein AQUCO_10400009v1 [Aquilegia coerulea]